MHSRRVFSGERHISWLYESEQMCPVPKSLWMCGGSRIHNSHVQDTAIVKVETRGARVATPVLRWHT